MSHALVIALFEDPNVASIAARELRLLGIPPQRVSIVARSHDEEGALARAADASPGSEIEDSRTASRLGELSAHLIAAVALVDPGHRADRRGWTVGGGSRGGGRSPGRRCGPHARRRGNAAPRCRGLGSPGSRGRRAHRGARRGDSRSGGA